MSMTHLLIGIDPSLSCTGVAALKWLADAASASSESPEARDWHFKDVQHGIEIARAAIAKAKEGT